MAIPHSIVVLKLHGQFYGLISPAVDRIIRLIEYYPLQNAPQSIIGVIHFHGSVLPLISMRRRFRLPERTPVPSDHLVLAHTQRRRVALLVDEACGFEALAPQDWVTMETVAPHVDSIAGIARRSDGLVLIHDLELCLSLDEEAALDSALSDIAALPASSNLPPTLAAANETP